MTALVHRDSPFFQRLNSHTAEKQRIAKAAVALIGDGETLLINGGSTTRFFAAELTQPNLTIVTNNLAIPGALSSALGAEIYLLGGQFQGRAAGHDWTGGTRWNSCRSRHCNYRNWWPHRARGIEHDHLGRSIDDRSNDCRSTANDRSGRLFQVGQTLIRSDRSPDFNRALGHRRRTAERIAYRTRGRPGPDRGWIS